MTRVLVCGGRDFKDRALVCHVLGKLHTERRITAVIHGDAHGADQEADFWAAARGIIRHRFPARWKEHGRAAGPIRNQAMLDNLHPDLVIAFPGGRWTADMVNRARVAGVPVIEVSQ